MTGPSAGNLAPGDRSLVRAVLGDGRPLLLTAAVAIAFAGGLALFLAVRGEFLPHDLAYLEATPEQLCAIRDCRVVDFMLHDRAAFGGTMLAVALLYVWLIAFPLSDGEPWAWWALVTTGGIGFATFLTYLGSGYLDTWHGWGTIVLLLVGIVGAVRAKALVAPVGGMRDLFARGGRPSVPTDERRFAAFGWGLVTVVVLGLVLVGAVILTVGTSVVFVPEDVAFIGATRAELDAVDPRLVPLIAHDRAGFGGTILVGGLLALLGLRHARGTRALWQALVGAVLLAFVPAIAVHHAVGYTDVLHLAPAYVGGIVALVGLVLARPRPQPTSSLSRNS